jgi:hypothetical protein
MFFPIFKDTGVGIVVVDKGNSQLNLQIVLTRIARPPSFKVQNRRPF